MNKVRKASLSTLLCFFVLLATSLSDASGCTVTVVGLRKEFRGSKNIFVGEVISIDGVPKHRLSPKLAEYGESLDKITFRIKKAWKGKRDGTIEVFSNVACICPMRWVKFEVGKEFMIFSDRDGFADACSMRIFGTADEKYKDTLRNEKMRLDNFWFRTWSRIYPS